MALLKLFLIFVLSAEVRISGADTLCTSISGTCQEDNLYCGGYYKSGLCSGGATRRCCVPSGADSSCTSISGTCQDDSLYCAGSYQSGLCSGGVTRRCCVPTGADSSCTSISGTCQDDSLYCAGSYQSGLCSGGVTRRCCVPTAGCSSINIITRSQWGARAPTATTAITVPVQKFFIHHTDTPACTSITDCAARVRNIQSYHMNTNGWSDIGYSFLVGEDGNVYEGRGWSYVGAHTSGQNSVAFAASMIGGFTSRLPNAQALSAVKGLIACGVQLGKITADYRLYGHRDAGQTSCPGNALYNEIQTWSHYSTIKP